METLSKSKKTRKYYIDWLRIVLIISVFFFHVGMIFRPEQWHINSAKSFAFLDPIMWWLHLWRMPLLFLVSGVGTYYAIGHRTSWQYVKERFRRLYIPFAFGFFTLVPLMVYVERIDQYGSFWNYIPSMFAGGPYPEGNISWHHLWFILYLFLISLMIAPFLNYTKTEHYKRLRIRLVNLTTKKFGLNWLLPVILVSQILLRHYFPNSTHALYNDWAYFAYYVFFFAAGFMLFTSDRVIQALEHQRRLYLIQTLVSTALLYVCIYTINDYFWSYNTYMVLGIVVAWSCGLTALGYFKKYFSQDHKYRAVLNEAIYPFYLLHQPMLIFVGYMVLQWDISYGLQAVLITILSLISIIGTYLIIKRFNFLRIAFGMKKKSITRTATKSEATPSPVFDK